MEIDPKDVDKELAYTQKIKQILSNLGQIVIGITELRNLVGTGHGRTDTQEISSNHVLLVVNSVETMTIFMINLWQEKKGSNLN